MTESTGSTGSTGSAAGEHGGEGDTRPLELPDEAAGTTPGYTVPPQDDDRGVEGVAEEPTE